MSIRFSLNTIPTLLTYVCSPFCHINNVFVYNLYTALRFSFCYSACKDSESRAECKEKVIIFFYCRDASYFRRSQRFFKTLLEEISSDDEPFYKKTRQLLLASLNNENADDFFIAICGWSLESLLERL